MKILRETFAFLPLLLLLAFNTSMASEVYIEMVITPGNQSGIELGGMGSIPDPMFEPNPSNTPGMQAAWRQRAE